MASIQALAAVAALLVYGAPPPAVAPPGAKPAADPNEKICQDIVMTGSRLATKRICATRAEWEAKQQQDKDVVNDIQRKPCMPTHNDGSGHPAC